MCGGVERLGQMKKLYNGYRTRVAHVFKPENRNPARQESPIYPSIERGQKRDRKNKCVHLRGGDIGAQRGRQPRVWGSLRLRKKENLRMGLAQNNSATESVGDSRNVSGNP